MSTWVEQKYYNSQLLGHEKENLRGGEYHYWDIKAGCMLRTVLDRFNPQRQMVLWQFMSPFYQGGINTAPLLTLTHPLLAKILLKIMCMLLVSEETWFSSCADVYTTHDCSSYLRSCSYLSLCVCVFVSGYPNWSSEAAAYHCGGQYSDLMAGLSTRHQCPQHGCCAEAGSQAREW